VKRTARMFDDRATPRSPFVVAYSPRSHPDTLTGSSLSSTLRIQFSILVFKSVTTPRALRANKYPPVYANRRMRTPLSEMAL
jgi:hypothetical protein